jgi:hypothetical protein
MIDFFLKLYFPPSVLLSNNSFNNLTKGASVLEEDVRGIKVLLLENGSILKIFRLRGFFTSSRIYSNARSFCRNAERLRKLGIPTVGKCKLLHFKNSTNTAVIYEPLLGCTLKELFHDNKMLEKDCINLGVFLANLHEQGIHFKSLHLGNIIRSNSGELGLIDIADMRIFPWRLMLKTRVRGFKRFLRYQDDIKAIGKNNWDLILKNYIDSSKLNKLQAEYLRYKISDIKL